MEPQVKDFVGNSVKTGDNVIYIQVIYRNTAELRGGVVTGVRPDKNLVMLTSTETGREVERAARSVLNAN